MARVLVLTYHSISDAAGPTSTPAHAFNTQMEDLKAAGYASMTVQDFLDWRMGKDVGERRVLITFDDGFLDFETAAFPILEANGLSALMFVPTRKVGAPEAWEGANAPARPLMNWAQIKSLSAAGVEFGSHSLTHADLTRIDPEQRQAEIVDSANELADRLGKPTRVFAAPYGRVNRAVVSEIREHYELGFGTRLNIPRRTDDPADIPRVEMFYYRDPRHWPAFLEGDETHFQVRRALRAVRETAMGMMHG